MKDDSFNPFCYNCAEFDATTNVCRRQTDEVDELNSCPFFNQRSDYSEEKIKKMIQLDKKRKRKVSQEEEKVADNKLGDALMVFNEDFVAMARKFWQIQPYYFDRSKIWWLWNFNDKCWEIIDEIDLLNTLKKHASTQLNITKTSVMAQIVKSLQLVGRNKKPEDAPKKWIQFKDKAYSIKSGNIYEVTKDYFFTNPLPYKIGEHSRTPTMDKLFEEWVGKEYVQTLYEVIAYCCYSDYPIQVLFCLFGGGRNGKSCFLNVLSKFIGYKNTCSTDLDLLVGHNKSRFEVFKLYKKLACLLGETNFGIMDNSAILKKLTGNDLIGFEVKGKVPFDDYNYAKVLIASNSLPSSEDTSEGFYRRWVIVDFPNQFKEGKDITETIPEEEYEALSKKVCEIIPKLLEKGEFTNQGTIAERTNKYILASNPLPMFLERFCIQEDGYSILYNELYTKYIQVLKKLKRRRVSRREFKSALESEGYFVEKTSKGVDGEWKSGLWVDGLTLIGEFEDVFARNCNSILYIRNEVTKPVKTSQNFPKSKLITDYVEEEVIED